MRRARRVRRALPLLGALAAALPLAVAIHAHAAIAESLTPRQVIQQTADEVLAVLARKELPLEERRALIQEIADSRFDAETISRLVLARHWRRFTPAQRETFIAEMKRHIVVNYGDRIDRYDQEGVEVLGERPEARGDVTVRTRITGGDGDGLAVDYRLRQREGRWYVIDVVVEGVSVLKSYRSQFQEILASGSPEQLLQQLREKNDAAAAAANSPASREAEEQSNPPDVAEPAAS